MANAANKDQQERKQLEQILQQRQADADFRWLMADPRGRRIVWALMGRCNVFSPVFNTHGGVMNFNEGRRDVGLFLLSEINRLCPHQFAVAADENAPKPESEETNDD
jgi:hypothetical protein